MNFNSIKVRLEQSAVFPEVERNGFQFHKGTIRTVSSKYYGSQKRDFNSIKVRLELISFSSV